MSKIENLYITILKDELSRRQRSNTDYSIRAFAKYLNIDQSSLCSILKGTRTIPKKHVEPIADKLGLEQSEKQKFKESVSSSSIKLKDLKPRKQARYSLSQEEFKRVSTPNAFAILTLLELDQFKYDTQWISNILNIEESLVIKVIQDLKEVDLVHEIDGSLYKTKNRVSSSDEIKSEEVFNFHKSTLIDAIEIGKKLNVEKRYFSTLTLPTNLDVLPKAKKIIKEFEDKIEALLDETQNRKDLVRLSLQFYPLTEVK